mgnify:CR=1 FL=1
MSILAIDTATQVSSVAVASVDKLAAELTMQAKLTHSETLMPHIKEVLRMANVRKENLEGIAVSIGPGSFTGLRIGLAAAKAMAYALNLPIVGVSTLKALAFHYPVPGIRIVSLLDAQKGKLRKYAEFQDMEIVGEYSDEGHSGKNIKGRQEFMRMLNDIEDGKDGVDFVLVFKLSRFGRNAADVLSSLQLMQDYGVNLICVEDGIDSSKEAENSAIYYEEFKI